MPGEGFSCFFSRQERSEAINFWCFLDSPLLTQALTIEECFQYEADDFRSCTWARDLPCNGILGETGRFFLFFVHPNLT